MLRQCKLTFVLVLCMRLILDVDAASDMCSTCTCHGSPIYVDCANRGLSSVPKPIPTNVESILLNDNNITVIPKETFKNLSRLKYLHMGNNKITNIKEGAFKDLTALQQLYLSNNNIAVIEDDSFQNLPKLRYLYLEYNKIRNIREDTFRNLQSLITLFLAYNKIENIEKEYFQTLSSIEKLYLGYNEISNIEIGTFQNLPNLTYIYLGYNKIKNIENGIFQSLIRLENLYLESNNIPNIGEQTFQNLPSLKELNLNTNKIMVIEDGAFQNLPNLKKLHLSFNQIKKYEDGAFLFLPNIIKINLRSNKDMMCGCHLPALVNYINKTYNRVMDVLGECHADPDNNQIKAIPILKYSQCKNYSLFQRNLQCQTCSGVICNASEVTTCPGEEPVCQYMSSTNGVTQKFERSCSTYRKCVDAVRNNTCHKWFNGPSCVACCTGKLCKLNDFSGLNTSFVFHLIYTTMNIKIPTANVSRAIEHDLLNLTGTFKVEYCGLEKNIQIFTVNCTVLSVITKDDIWHKLYNILNTSETLRNLGIQQGNMKLIGEMFCNENTSTNNGTFYWPMTKIGSNVMIPCHGNVATRHCSSRTIQDMSSPKCSPFSGIWQEPDMSQCYNTGKITQQLNKIKNEDIDKGNIEEISKQLVNISQKSVFFEEEDINLAVDIQEKMMPLISDVSANITLNNVLLSINNMINTPEKVLVEAEQSERTVNRMLDIIQTIQENISLEEQHVAVLYSNLGIGTAKVEKDTFNGFFYGILDENHVTEARNMIYNSSQPDLQQEDITMMDYISIPKSLLKHLTDEEQSAFSRISFSSMREDKLYRIIYNSSTKENYKINSYIIAASIPNIRITNLDELVTVSFNLINKNATNPQCVYWDESPGQKPTWSTKGCEVSNYVPGKKVFCSCNHLTSFALLMDIYGTTIITEPLSMISYIGCGISAVFLIVTILIHVCSRNLRKLMITKILVNLCSSLAVTNIIFIVGMQPYATEITAVCKTVAALLHYFLLASIMWTTVEAIHVFLSVVVVFNTYQKSFMRRSSILAWGLPAAIVIINLVINYTDNYVRIAQVCWLSRMSFYATILCPVGIILIYNLTIFSLVICRLIAIQNNNKFEHKTRKIRFFGIVGLFFLFGLSWSLAIFAFGEVAEVFTYLFTIFNTLQGMFIFIFYCIYKKDTRDIICLHICNRKKGDLRKDINDNRSSSGKETRESTGEMNLTEEK